MDQTGQSADYVIIGAGSAGCVIASRLSETGASVILLEAGPPDRSPWIHIPAGVVKLLRHPVLSWNYRGEADPAIGGRQIEYPRGRTLGGSSSINGMNWVRGHRADYDRWAQMGATGWSYDDVLPHLKAIETYRDGGGDVRGHAGPIPVQPYDLVLPLTHRFLDAAEQTGHPRLDDLNGERPLEGAAYTQLSHTGRRRASTAQTFLKAAKGRPNLTVETGAMALRLLFEGRRCTGVLIRQNGTDRTVTARREVILSGGAINSPQLLQISGVGPAAHLASIGVQVLHDLPGVGRNLNDHYGCRVTVRVKDTLTVNHLAHGWRLWREAAKYALFGKGAFTLGVTTAQLFARTRPDLAAPDLQMLFTPGSHSPKRLRELEREPGMNCTVSVTNPESRGEVMARSPDPFQHPAIDARYLSSGNDLRTLVAGIRMVREVFAASAFAPYRVAEIGPGPAVQSDAELETYARATGTTLHHVSGTCRMGIDPMAVVDPQLRVHGLDGLRVADASVMPAVTTGNTNASVVMIGEKAAAMIAGRA